MVNSKPAMRVRCQRGGEVRKHTRVCVCVCDNIHLFQFPGAAITQYHQLSGLKTIEIYSLKILKARNQFVSKSKLF